jgi:glycosyltransferase involved in cell wall biosynthesis
LDKQPTKIGLFQVNPGYGGGNIYQKAVIAALSKEFDVENFDVAPKILPKAYRPRTILNILNTNSKINNVDIWIRNYLGIVGMKFVKKQAKNIALLFHIDYDFMPNKRLSLMFDKYFWKNLKKCETVVVIAEFWKKYLSERGINNSHVIQPAQDISKFSFKEAEVEEFIRKYSLSDKPIIYLGNCQKEKGVKEAYESLKSFPYHLVTSGKKEIDIPAKNLNLDYREYLLLLKASSVVLTMSHFLEGWNITAHEAMLCRTPVIGSGRGGMEELLEGGKQLICKDFSELPEMISYALENAEKLGDDGYEHGKRFTVEKFDQQWTNLVRSVSTGFFPG